MVALVMWAGGVGQGWRGLGIVMKSGPGKAILG